MDESRLTRVQVGTSGQFEFTLVPRTTLTLDAPQPGTIQALQSPGGLEVEVPIQGTCKNFPSGDLPCQLTWLVLKAGAMEPEAFPVADAVIKFDSRTRFHVEVGGRAPKVDLLKQKLFGAGALGYRIAPRFPHAPAAELAPGALRFNNPLDLRVTTPGGSLRFGSKVTFAASYGRIFDAAILQVRIVENDEGEAQTVGPGGNELAAFQWTRGNQAEWAWYIGFQDSARTRMCYCQAAEAGDYEYTYVFEGSSDGGRTFTVIKQDSALLKPIPRPKLTSFSLTRDQSLWLDTIYAQGQIENFVEGVGVELQVALVTHDMVGAPAAGALRRVTGRLEPGGRFKIELVPWLANAHYNPEKSFAILSFSELSAPGGSGMPLSAWLAFDASTFICFDDAAMDIAYGNQGRWICSTEVSRFRKTPAQLLEDATVKRVLYLNGQVDAEVHDKLKKILRGDLQVTKDEADLRLVRTLKRALVYTGFPTFGVGGVGATGSYKTSGGYDEHMSNGVALMLREWAPEDLLDDAGNPISESTLVFHSSYDGRNGAPVTPDVLSLFPTVPIRSRGLAGLLNAIQGLTQRKEIYLGSPDAAITNLDLLDQRRYPSTRDIVSRYKEGILRLLQDDYSDLNLNPIWVAAVIKTETNGLPVPKFEHHLFRSYYLKLASGRDWSTAERAQAAQAYLDEPANRLSAEGFKEARMLCTSYGLGQLMGFNIVTAKVKGRDGTLVTPTHPRQLLMADEADQVRMVLNLLIRPKNAAGIRPDPPCVRFNDYDISTPVEVLRLLDVESAQDCRALAHAYNGSSYAEKGYHNLMFQNFHEVKAIWNAPAGT
ncbi:N-acetylmuramidase domain-containing protein [Archangium lansingense]|uniref:N-acetylmuramidase domain-containing protein n=1 Tax=Archangium lansingense TaxID=2995310 RepID=A0ABT4AE03_9BACT|nr:N-acetylmuramidase domain-containing protein [Archangium lansinium]MCY1079551.1 N-acetylmuramidase domain-containing protein [Archangium lansinium]